jgi:hypothetical protein
MKEDFMSSQSPAVLTTADLDMLQEVWKEAGYDAPASLRNQSAAKEAKHLLTKIFREGMTSKAELATELERRLGKRVHFSQALAPALHRYAMQGVPQVVKDDQFGARHKLVSKRNLKSVNVQTVNEKGKGEHGTTNED